MTRIIYEGRVFQCVDKLPVYKPSHFSSGLSELLRIVRPVVAPLTNQVKGQAPSRILPPSNIICKKLTINRENSGISPKRHQIRVPQIDSIGVDV